VAQKHYIRKQTIQTSDMDTLMGRGNSVRLVIKPRQTVMVIQNGLGMARSKKKYKSEKCVACGAGTNYSRQDPIDYRYGYVEGVGQFCFKCSYFGTTTNQEGNK